MDWLDRLAPLTPEGWDEAGAEGYLYLPGLLDPEPLHRLRATIEAFCRELRWLDDDGRPTAAAARAGDYDDPAWVAMQQAVAVDPVFVALANEPRLLAAIERLLGEPVRSSGASVCRVFAPGGARTTRPHQDHHYVSWSGSLWTAWIPLGDCQREAGGLAVLPRVGQASGLLPHAAGDDVAGGVGDGFDGERWATTDYRAGDVLLFHCLTLHRALPNGGDRLRFSTDHRFQPASHTWPPLPTASEDLTLQR